MKVFNNIKEWQHYRKSISSEKNIGFIPTMGALHQGHLELVKRSIKENEFTCVSIFVNPTQFNDKNDFVNYPQPLEHDLKLLSDLKVTAVVCPTKEMLYPDNFVYQVQESELSKLFCGKYREGHFTGVLTIVLKLLNLVKATNAYFGEKDYQQLQLIKGMCDAFFIDTTIVPCPTIREIDGLAMSSRNTRLSESQRLLAPRFHAIMKQSLTPPDAIKQLSHEGFVVDYIEDYKGRRLGAVKLGDIRLIDNIQMEVHSEERKNVN